jgi:hypothetical protein
LGIPFEGAVALVVDAQGMACPLPILKAKKALSTLLPGFLSANGQFTAVAASSRGLGPSFLEAA